MSKDATFWDKIAERYAREPIGDEAGYHKTLERIRARLAPDHSVVELGCGTGSTAFELAEGVARYTATDVSSRMIEIAEAKRDTQTPEHLTFRVSDATALPGTPDVVLALNLLHLLTDTEAALAAIHEALPPGGLFISKTATLRDGAWYLAYVIPVMRLIGKAPFVRSFANAELTDLITEAGFEIEDMLVQPGNPPRLFLIARKPAG